MCVSVSIFGFLLRLCSCETRSHRILTHIFIHISIYRHPHTRTRTQHSGANKHSVTDGDTTREIFARHAAPMTASQKLNSCIFNSTANAWKFRKIQKQNKKKQVILLSFLSLAFALLENLEKWNWKFLADKIFLAHTHTHTHSRQFGATLAQPIDLMAGAA